MMTKDQAPQQLTAAEEQLQLLEIKLREYEKTLKARNEAFEAYEKRAEQRLKVARARGQHAERYIQQLLLQIQMMEADQ